MTRRLPLRPRLPRVAKRRSGRTRPRAARGPPGRRLSRAFELRIRLRRYMKPLIEEVLARGHTILFQRDESRRSLFGFFVITVKNIEIMKSDYLPVPGRRITAARLERKPAFARPSGITFFTTTLVARADYHHGFEHTAMCPCFILRLMNFSCVS